LTQKVGSFKLLTDIEVY